MQGKQRVRSQHGVRLRIVLLGPQAPAAHAHGREDDEQYAGPDVAQRHHEDHDVNLPRALTQQDPHVRY